MKRVEWIDICKSVAIFCMVFLHLGLELPHRCVWIDKAVHYWHMPLFIVLSGVVLNTEKWCGWSNFGRFLLSRVKSLLVPLVAFGAVCLVFNAMYLFPDGVQPRFGTLRQSLLYPNSYLHMYELQWFLLCLFVSETVFVLLYNLAGGRRFLTGVLCALLLAGGHVLLQHTGRLPFTLDSAVYAVPMFAVGALGREMFTQWRPLRKGWAQVLAVAVLAVLFILVKGKFNVRVCAYDPLWIYPFGIAVTVAVIWLIREQEGRITRLKCYGAIKWLGTNTLAILVLNGSVRKIIPWRHLVTCDSPLLTFGVQLLSSLVTIVIIYFIWKLVMRYAPWMLGKSPLKNS